MKAFVPFAALVLCMAVARAEEPAAQATEETKAQVEALVKKLASEKYEERQAASVALLQLGPAIYEFVKRARDETNDLESRSQLGFVLLHWPAPREPLRSIPNSKEEVVEAYKRLYGEFVRELQRIMNLKRHFKEKNVSFEQTDALGEIYNDVLKLQWHRWGYDLKRSVKIESIDDPYSAKIEVTTDEMHHWGTLRTTYAAVHEDRARMAANFLERWQRVKESLDDTKDPAALASAKDELDRYLRFLSGKSTPLADRVRFEPFSLQATRAQLSDVMLVIEFQTGLFVRPDCEETENKLGTLETTIDADNLPVAEVLKTMLEPHGLTYKLVPEDKPTTIQICKK